MGIVIGFNWPIEHDNSAAAIVDGKLVFVAEEERFTRHKHSIAEPPFNALYNALYFLKKEFGIKPQDISDFAINYSPYLFSKRVRKDYIMYEIKRLSLIYETSILSMLRENLFNFFFNADYSKLAYELIRAVYRKLDAPLPNNIKIHPVIHHLTHAATAYYFSGFNSSAILTVDGSGEIHSTVIWKVKNGEFEPIASIPTMKFSLGMFYQNVTRKLKYDFLEGPGKVMGLAPYGKYNEGICTRFNKFSPVIRFLNEGFNGEKIKSGKFVDEYYNDLANEVSQGLDLDWNPKGELKEDVVDLAWCIQHFTEQAMLDLAKWARDHTGEDKLGLAGGVALNAKANMEIYYSMIFNDMFIFPAANDAGGPIGAAAWVYEHVLGEKMKNERLEHVYFGPKYSDEEIKKIVERTRFKAEYIGNDVSAVADLVAKGQIVTWYQGRAELGPRALGHRSIIADPRRKEYWRLVNDIKGREWWRPLAPSLLLEDADKYFKDPTHHPFMILMMRFKDEEVCKRVPVVCHVDMTARPQSVTGKEDKNWYNLIKAFKELTGEGIIMNTSFNLAGEPLVETPQDAIKSFAFGGFDAMYLQGWLIHKR